MKKTSIFIVVCLVIFVTGNAFCSLVISKLLGKSGVYQETTKEWATPAVGLALDKGDKLKTFENGKVELTFDDGTTLWVKENTEINITLLLPEDRVISLNKGQIRSKVTPLKVGQAFTVKTKTAVAAIRGTEFIMVMGDAGSKLLVVSGKIEYANTISNVSFPVVEGQSCLSDEAGGIAQPAAFTIEDTAIVQDTGWNEIKSAPAEPAPEEPAPAEEPQKEETKKELNKLRQEIKDMVSDIKTNVQVVKEIIQEIRDSDISSGRTLRDAHGNLVRVEQYLMRPTLSTVQLMNITKRDSYTYKGYFTGSNGVSNSEKRRVDMFEGTITFGDNVLPDKLSDWPGFFSANKDTVKPTKMVMKMTNGKDAFIAEYEYVREKTDTSITAEPIEPTPDDNPDDNTKEEKWEWGEGKIIYKSGTLGEWLVDFDYESSNESISNNKEGEETSVLQGWGVSPEIRLYKDNDGDSVFSTGDTPKYVNMGTEFWVIGNDGGLFTKDKITGLKGGNPFTFLKEIAIEQSMFCKINSETTPQTLTSLTDFNNLPKFFDNNIDLVITPDIMMSIAMKLGSAFENMSSKSILRRKDTI